mmetsp:Transcript_18527/g.42251  ORF Transcript_18527/g.42251 Transcript_18527/m.42251 type:complete len:582 (-) Transcript_18527:1314-3059(-)
MPKEGVRGEEGLTTLNQFKTTRNQIEDSLNIDLQVARDAMQRYHNKAQKFFFFTTGFRCMQQWKNILDTKRKMMKLSNSIFRRSIFQLFAILKSRTTLAKRIRVFLKICRETLVDNVNEQTNETHDFEFPSNSHLCRRRFGFVTVCIKNIISCLNEFDNLSNELLTQIAKHMQLKRFGVGEQMITDTITYYLLIDGLADHYHNDSEVRNVTPGSSWNISCADVLHATDSTTSSVSTDSDFTVDVDQIVAKTECICLTILESKLYEILTYLAGMPEWMDAFRMDRMTEDKNLDALVKTLPLINEMSDDVRRKLVSNSSIRTYDPNYTIYKQGRLWKLNSDAQATSLLDKWRERKFIFEDGSMHYITVKKIGTGVRLGDLGVIVTLFHRGSEFQVSLIDSVAFPQSLKIDYFENSGKKKKVILSTENQSELEDWLEILRAGSVTYKYSVWRHRDVPVVDEVEDRPPALYQVVVVGVANMQMIADEDEGGGVVKLSMVCGDHFGEINRWGEFSAQNKVCTREKEIFCFCIDRSSALKAAVLVHAQKMKERYHLVIASFPSLLQGKTPSAVRSNRFYLLLLDFNA